MAEEDKDYTEASKAVVNAKRAEIQHAKDMAKALERELKKVHKSFLTDEDTKQQLRQEILNGVRGRGQSSNLDRLTNRLRGGEGTLQDFEPDSVVGNEEPYWNEDD